MTRFIATAAFACGLAIAVNAQDTKTTTTTTVKGDESKSVTYTGCVQTGTETRTFVLDKVVPVSRSTSETVGTTGTTTSTTTTYALVPGETVELQTHVGHKVEVTGEMIPGGDSKTKTTTKVDREDGPDSKTKETVKRDDALPQFRVTSIKNLAERCE
jgi:hypothetical protein